VNCVNKDGLTPLYLGVSSQTETDAEVVEMLLRDYAQHGVCDEQGSTELHQVCVAISQRATVVRCACWTLILPIIYVQLYTRTLFLP